MILSEIRPNVLFLKFDSRYLAAATMMRIQEFYESPLPGIRGQYFTLEQYMDAYAAVEGNFDYTLEWEAFNVPDYSLRAFWAVFVRVNDKQALLEKERKLFKLLQKWMESEGRFYLIGMAEKDMGYIGHELAHAYYYLDEEYKLKMDKAIKAYPRYEEMKKIILSGVGYDENVVDDEIQAYLSTGTVESIKKDIEFKVKSIELEEFNGYFKRYEEMKCQTVTS